MCLAYIDLDDFKSYNDRYGYQRGDAVILLAAGVIMPARSRRKGAPDDFVGHIGGDDFVVLTDPAVDGRDRRAASSTAFDEAIPAFYDDETRERGWFEATDRRGVTATACRS